MQGGKMSFREETGISRVFAAWRLLAPPFSLSPPLFFFFFFVS